MHQRIHRRNVAFTVLALGVCVGASTTLAAPYVDTKKRFSVELPDGWALAPIPMDTGGMMFKKANTAGFLRISVEKLDDEGTARQFIEKTTEPFRNEIGFQPGADLETEVGTYPALERTLSVFASGDATTVRSVHLVVVVAFGYAHLFQFESTKKDAQRLVRDKQQILGRYRPLSGRAVYAPLVGEWASDAGGPRLSLTAENTFVMGPLRGRYRADGGKLMLLVDEGRESYRYTLEKNALTLRSPNLEEPATYSRLGSRVVEDDGKKSVRRGALRRDEVLGKWRVVTSRGDEIVTTPLVLILAPSGSMSFGAMAGNFSFSGGRIEVRSLSGTTVVYRASLDEVGDVLTLSGGDLDGDIRLSRLKE